jgi:hypothetical protein
MRTLPQGDEDKSLTHWPWRRWQYPHWRSRATTPFHHTNMRSTLGVWNASPSIIRPTSGAANIKHDGNIPVTVKVTWIDGTAWTGQWTNSHVCVVRETAPSYHPFWVRASDVRRR